MSVQVLKFSAAWCGPCRVLSETLKDVDGIDTIDIDQEMDRADKYNIKGVPTLLFLKDGEEVERLSGAISLSKYQEVLSKING